MTDAESRVYTVAPDPEDSDRVIVTDPDGRVHRIHCEDADPEHRFTYMRLAAGWFGNLPDVPNA